MGKLLPILFAIIGLGAGIGAGLLLRPAPETAVATSEGSTAEPAEADTHGTDAHGEAASEAAAETTDSSSEFVKMNNQMVIPVVKNETVAALVVVALSLEVPSGATETVYQREPKLRDMFLQVLFDHANSGGFDGTFTTGPKMDALREALRSVAKSALGDDVRDILITDIARQDL